jgi:hypothetical protein
MGARRGNHRGDLLVKKRMCLFALPVATMDPKGKVAILTGGARIGQVVAHALALRGCNFALTYRGSRDAAEASAQAAIREECVRSRFEPMPPTKTRSSAPSRRPIASSGVSTFS